MAFVHHMICNNSDVDIIIEDDDRVGYAYLRRGGRIEGDVWLYNRIPAPIEPEWEDRDKAPFANPKGFAFDPSLITISDTASITIECITGRDGIESVRLLTEGKLLAVLALGAKPGWSRNAAKDGPLAKLLTR